jgi:chromate transporter
MQLAALGGGALGGAILCRHLRFVPFELRAVPARWIAWTALAVFLLLLAVLPVAAAVAPHGSIALADAFYRPGALVFGVGHVVLPMLHEALVPGGWVTGDSFLAGYGFAQAMPGPLFSVAAYLGAASAPAHAAPAWAALAVFAIFLPGLLLATTAVSLWSKIAHIRAARSMLAGVNAAVVGVLGAALYDPVCTSAIGSSLDAAIVIAGIVLLQRWRVPPIVVVALCVTASVAAAYP